MRRMLLPAFCIAGALFPGCLYIAPIELEDDVLPFVNTNAVTPTPGVVELDLAEDDQISITVSSYGDENADQDLYHRLVIDLRPGGEYTIVATEPGVTKPDRRDRIMYKMKPCSMLSRYGEIVREGRSVDMYFILSDKRFMLDSEIVISKDGEFLQPFKTDPENRAVWVQWSVVFKGECPSGGK